MENGIKPFNIDKENLLRRINVEKGMISLTDLWKAAGSNPQQTPAKWQETESAKGFLLAVSRLLNIAKNDVLKSKQGKGGGTYAHKQVALEYAQYLDPQLGVLVNEVFFQRIEEEKNPDLAVNRAIKTYKKQGRSDKWIMERLEGKGIRNLFTSTLAEHGVNGEGYRDCTNAIYNPLLGGKAEMVRKERNLPKSANIRDNLSFIEL
ncbi:hypothetical protein EZS27_003903 [termite gut metagenome]|uniref:KilA-N domain-containing protein n=1 Tax=termite gut metagenome TaxID=433724 RepID=A0A5J4STT0_9ZZZZ